MFWAIYKNLEKEIIELSYKLHFCDGQEYVYSIQISDLLIRTSVEIEALSKELYKTAGGDMNLRDSDGNNRDLLFDSDCLQYLDIKWKLTKKRVKVVCPTFYFKKKENLELQPLKDCNKRGKGRWKKAYQAVKHDRVNSLKLGNIGNLIRALASLYVLNIYYRNKTYELGTILHSTPFDTRLGSDIFAASIIRADEYNFDNMRFTNTTKDDFDTAMLIQKFKDESFNQIVCSLKKFKEDAKEVFVSSHKTLEFIRNNPEYKFSGYLKFAKDIGGDAFVHELLQGQSVVDYIKNAQIEVVLNKQQKVYTEEK